MSKVIEVAVAWDDPRLFECLWAYAARIPDLQVRETSVAALLAAAQPRPDVVLVEVARRDCIDPVADVRKLCRAGHRVLALSKSSDPYLSAALLSTGACLLLGRNQTMAAIVAAIRAAGPMRTRRLRRAANGAAAGAWTAAASGGPGINGAPVLHGTATVNGAATATSRGAAIGASPAPGVRAAAGGTRPDHPGLGPTGPLASADLPAGAAAFGRATTPGAGGAGRAGGRDYTAASMPNAARGNSLLRPRLSQRERSVLIAYTSGLTLDAVAQRVGIRPSTAKTYLERVKAKYRQIGRPAYTKLDLAQRAREDGPHFGDK